MCLQCSMKPGCSAQLSGGVQDTLSLVMLSPFFKLALEIERMHVQELSRAEPHEFMQPEPFAQRLDVPLAILASDWWDFSGVRGSQWAAGCWRGVISKSSKGHVYVAVSASAGCLSRGIYSIFNSKQVLFSFWVTAASSALSVVSPDLLALFILIRLALALSEAENPMSLLIRKWHPL